MGFVGAFVLLMLGEASLPRHAYVIAFSDIELFGDGFTYNVKKFAGEVAAP